MNAVCSDVERRNHLREMLRFPEILDEDQLDKLESLLLDSFDVFSIMMMILH